MAAMAAHVSAPALKWFGGFASFHVGRSVVDLTRVVVAGEGHALAFEIEYSPDAEAHLRALTSRERSVVLDEVQL